MDAGAALTVNGPNGSREPTRDASGSYSALLGGAYLTPGGYTLTAAGGADVGRFDVPFVVPPAPVWTNKNPAAYARSFSPTFNWTLRRPADYVAAYAYGRNDLTAFYTVCTADPAAGTITIASYVYAGLVQHTSAAPGVIWIGSGTASRFAVPGLDFGFINTVSGTEGVFIP